MPEITLTPEQQQELMLAAICRPFEIWLCGKQDTEQAKFVERLLALSD